MTKTVKLMCRPKGTNKDWKIMTGIPVTNEEDAKDKIRKRNDIMDKAFEFAIQVTTLTPYNERQ